MKKPCEPARQRRTRFVKEFLLDRNATRAAIAAGYSKKAAGEAGSRLLKDVRIRELVNKQLTEVNKKLDISVERVALELARLAYFDPRALYNEDGSAKAITELDEDTARAIAGFEMAELFTGSGEERGLAGYVKKFKLADKGANLERLGKHLQMFPSPPQELKVTHDSADNTERLIQLLAAAASRAE